MSESAFDQFQNGVDNRPPNRRSSAAFGNPSAENSVEESDRRMRANSWSRGIGRGRPSSTDAFVHNVPPDQVRVGDNSRNSDMSIDNSINRAQHTEGHGTQRPAPTSGGLEAVVMMMMEENRRRDAQRDALLERLFSRLDVSSNVQRNNSGLAGEPHQNYQVMPALSTNIQEFTSNESSTEAREWITNIESMCVLHRWPETFAMESARMHLKDGARDWFSAHRRELITWDAFRQAFRTTYVRQDSAIARWRRMADRVQKRDEPLQQYFHNKVKLCTDLNLNVLDTKEQVLVGLWSKDMFHAMSSRTHTTIDDLLHDMLEYGHLVNQ